MADTIDTIKLSPTESFTPIHTSQKRTPLWSQFALGAVVLLSLFMNFFQLGQNGYGNLYYAAGVRSMLDNTANFFFVSLDPGGFVSVDKPPLGFWLQAISAKLLGFTPFSIFLPQALCGVLAVLLLYYLVRRHFGVTAGLVAALVLAVSPISVVTNRNNTIDSTLALIMLLAAWAVIRAAESGKLRWLLLSGVFVGLGFNTKMAEAYLIVPALVMTYLLCAPRKVWTRLWHLALFVVVFFALSLSWIVAVDLVPASQRPYVGSTPNNSAVGLAFGYNGISRFRINGDIFDSNSGANTTSPNTRTTRTDRSSTATRTQTTRPTGISESGTPGLLRLISPSLGGQVGWLLPFACIGIVALLFHRRLRFRSDRQQLGLVLWGFWLLAMGAFFSLDGSFHQYYMVVMVPGLSALVGIGMAILWQDYRSVGWRGWLLPLALVVTAVTQIHILKGYPIWSQRLSLLIEGFTALGVLALILFRLLPRLRLNISAIRVARIAVSIGLFTLLIAPTVWASYSVFQNIESAFFGAGPRYNDTTGKFFSSGQPVVQNGLPQSYAPLISYLQAHQGKTKFLVATVSSGTSSPIILATNKPVMTLGGYNGNDPILTTSKLQILIRNGAVRYFLLNLPRSIQRAIDALPKQYHDRFRDGNFGQQGTLTAWISEHCSTVPARDWTATGRAGNMQLYDCIA
jgi:4-amino-4-deoxy-L-arabinose transferase-like glycosyltransferase